MLIPAGILRNPIKNCFGWVGVRNLSFLFRSNHLRNPYRNSLCIEVRRKLHWNFDQIFILYSLPIPTFDDHHRSNKQLSKCGRRRIRRPPLHIDQVAMTLPAISPRATDLVPPPPGIITPPSSCTPCPCLFHANSLGMPDARVPVRESSLGRRAQYRLGKVGPRVGRRVPASDGAAPPPRRPPRRPPRASST